MRGFTLVELLTALMISFIVLTAIVTLVYAMNSAYQSTSDMNVNQARVRYTTLYLSELIKHSKLICDSHSTELIIWQKDTNNDNQINVSEIIYLETGSGKYLRLLQFNPTSPSSDIALSLPTIKNEYLKGLLIHRYPETYTTLIDKCRDMKITLDRSPPFTQLLNITFGIERKHDIHAFQISIKLRCYAGNLISAFGVLSSDDDDSP